MNDVTHIASCIFFLSFCVGVSYSPGFLLKEKGWEDYQGLQSPVLSFERHCLPGAWRVGRGGDPFLAARHSTTTPIRHRAGRHPAAEGETGSAVGSKAERSQRLGCQDLPLVQFQYPGPRGGPETQQALLGLWLASVFPPRCSGFLFSFPRNRLLKTTNSGPECCSLANQSGGRQRRLCCASG